MAEQDVTNRIERIEEFEERAGVRLEAIFACQDPEVSSLQVNGELHPRGGTAIEQDLVLEMAAYDDKGRLVGKTEEHIFKDEGYGFQTFGLFLHVPIPINTIAKIRLIPRLSSL